MREVGGVQINHWYNKMILFIMADVDEKRKRTAARDADWHHHHLHQIVISFASSTADLHFYCLR